MAAFIYHFEKNGQIIKDKITAKNLHIAKLKLKVRNIDVVYIKQQPLIPFISGGGKIKSRNLLFFTRQIAFLLNAGVSLIQSLEMTVDTTSDLQLKNILRHIVKDLERGKSLSQAMRMYPHVFDGFYVNMIICAETTGLLDQILRDLGNYIEKREMIKSRVKSAMMYPVIVLCISLLIISGIILYVVPKFASLYGSSGSELPALTQSLMNLSNLMKSNPLLLAGVFFGVPIALYQYYKTENGKKTLIDFINIIPLFNSILYQAALVKFTRSFSCLLKAGV